MTNLKNLYADRKDVYSGILDLEGRAAKEGRDFTADEREQWDKMYEKVDELTKDIERTQKSEELRKQMALENKEPEKKPEKRTYAQAFAKYVMKAELDSEDRALLNRNRVEQRGTNTQITTTDSLGGYLVPEEWYNQIVTDMVHYSGALEAAQRYGGIIQSNSGGKLNIPFNDDTSTDATLTGEGSSTTIQDFTFSEVVLDAYTYRTIALASIEQLQDSGYPLEQFIREQFAPRFGRPLNASTTTGDGSSKPNGFMSATSAGKTAAATNAFTRQEILDLIASVDRAFRANAAFQLSDEALFDIRALTIGSGDDRPLWQPSIRDGEPDRIEGFPYLVNNDIAKPSDGASSKIMAFGDWSYFKIRLVGGMNMKVLTERYADDLKVGYLAWQRWDSDLINSSAIKHMVTAAS